MHLISIIMLWRKAYSVPRLHSSLKRLHHLIGSLCWAKIWKLTINVSPPVSLLQKYNCRYSVGSWMNHFPTVKRGIKQTIRQRTQFLGQTAHCRKLSWNLTMYRMWSVELYYSHNEWDSCVQWAVINEIWLWKHHL